MNDFPYTPERVTEIISHADEWADAFWHGRHSPHGDHGPIIAVIELAKAYRRIQPPTPVLTDGAGL